MPSAGWSETSEGLSREFLFAGFPQAMAFAVEVGRLAETAQHHPDIEIRWNRVHLRLITHDAGHRVTEHDHALATQINLLSPEQIAIRAQEMFV